MSLSYWVWFSPVWQAQSSMLRIPHIVVITMKLTFDTCDLLQLTTPSFPPCTPVHIWKIKCNASSSLKSQITGIKHHYELFIKNKALIYTRSFLPTLCRPSCLASRSDLGSICLQIRKKAEILGQSCLIEHLAPSCGQILEAHTWALKTSVSAVETGFPGVASFFSTNVFRCQVLCTTRLNQDDSQ